MTIMCISLIIEHIVLYSSRIHSPPCSCMCCLWQLQPLDSMRRQTIEQRDKDSHADSIGWFWTRSILEYVQERHWDAVRRSRHSAFCLIQRINAQITVLLQPDANVIASDARKMMRMEIFEANSCPIGKLHFALTHVMWPIRQFGRDAVPPERDHTHNTRNITRNITAEHIAKVNFRCFASSLIEVNEIV